MKRSNPLLALAAFSLLAAPSARAGLPAAADDFAVTRPGESVLIDVLGNDLALGANLRLLKAFKPAHGSAAIENGRIRYTPAAGYQGSDSFRYLAQAAASQPGQATVEVEVGQVGVSLRLVGSVVDSPIPNSTVKVSIGGYDFIATADANGNYVLDIAALRGDAFVTLEATGTSTTGAPVQFYSAVGEIVRLASAAGGDGVLTRDEFNQVNVTNLSTAQYQLLAAANGGDPVTSDQQLLPLTQNIDINELLELAAIIKLVVDEGVPLPAGVTDALSLISDPAALDAFKASLAPGQLDLAVDQVAQDPNLTPGFRAGLVPNDYSLVFASAPGTVRSNITPIGLLRLTGTSSGSATLVDPDANTDDRWTWVLDNGDVVLDKVLPQSSTYFDTNPNCTAKLMQVTETITQMRLHRLQDGAGVDYVEAGFTADRQYVDDDPADACPVPANGPSLLMYQVLGFEDHAGELPFATNEAFGQFVLATYAPSAGNFFLGAAVFDFGTHTVTHPDLQPAFAASIVDGRLEMDVTDAHDGSVVHQQYRRLQQDGAKGEGLFILQTLADGRQRTSYSMASRIDGSASFDSAGMVGLWRSGFDIARFQGDGTVGAGFYAVNNADFTGNQRTIDNFGAVFNNFPWTWAVESGSFIARTYRAPGFGTKNSCAGFDPCFLTRTRSWQPVARSSNRIYVLEELDDRSTATGPWKVSGQRMNFYELQP